jgi:prepilin-type N-terminal cleavage/methylation domain-containing protein
MKYFSSLKSQISIRKGFTLIELLIVIAILGVLAAALIATIDPFEQIKKGGDSRVKELATQFLEANVRYYANHGALPWHAAANGGENCYTGGNTLSAVALSSLTTCIQSLTADGELKQSFTSSTDLPLVTVTNPNPQTTSITDSIVCFLPKSKSQQKDVSTKYNQDGTIAANCKSQGGTAACYWCTQ